MDEPAFGDVVSVPWGWDMSDRPKSSFSEAAKNWVQSVAIVMAGLWGVYTFVWSEIVAPQTAPVNISTDIQIEDVGEVISDDNRRLRAVQITINAVNPSSRIVYLLPNYWVAYGLTLGSAPDTAQWTGALGDQLNQRQILHAGRHFTINGGQIVAANTAFADTSLKPNERISRTVLFYVPSDMYDFIQVEAVMPTADYENQVDVQYTFDNEGLNVHVFEISGETRTPREFETPELEALVERTGLSQSSSLRQQPLGRSTGSPAQ